jgi:DNA-binding CsgD family transcriptional regulator
MEELNTSSEAVVATLTPREQEVFYWLGQGKRNSEIAVIIQCGVRTVEKHVENILRKTDSENRMCAVMSL